MATKEGIRKRFGLHEITVHDVVETENDYGEKAITFAPTPLCRRKAAALSKGGREFWKASQVMANLSLILSIHHDAVTATIGPRMRVTFRGRDLDVIAVENVNELDEEVLLYCSEIVES